MPNLNYRIAAMSLGLLLVFLLTACNQAEAAPIDSATTGEITVYTAMDVNLAESYLTIFRQEYPQIKVNLVQESTGDLTQRFFNEDTEHQTDVIWGVDTSRLLLAEWNNLLEPYAPVGLEGISPLFRDMSSPPTWVGIDVSMLALCINRTELATLGLPVPESWQDLLDPAYEDHLVMPNPSTTSFGYLIVSNLLYFYGEQNGWDYLDGLDQNVAQYTTPDTSLCQLVAAGDYAIGISYVLEGLTLAREDNSMETVFLSEGATWGVRANALVRKNDTKKAAQTFLDWAISDETMALYAQDEALITVKTAPPIPEGFPTDPVAQLMDRDSSWVAANRQQILTEWLTRYGSRAEASD